MPAESDGDVNGFGHGRQVDARSSSQVQQAVQDLQLSLERELVDHLRGQNAKLMVELDGLRQGKQQSSGDRSQCPSTRYTANGTRGICRATIVYILVIGLLEHRTYMLVLMDAFVGIIGMVAEEVWEEDWTPSRPHGKPGEASADPKLICLSCLCGPVMKDLSSVASR